MGTLACTLGSQIWHFRNRIFDDKKERKKETASLNYDVTYLFLFFFIMMLVICEHMEYFLASMEYIGLFMLTYTGNCFLHL